MNKLDICEEIKKTHVKIKELLQINDFYKLFCKNSKLCVCLKWNHEQQSKNPKNNKNKLFLKFEIDETLSKKVFKVPTSIKKFLFTLTSEFNSTIFLNDKKVKKDHINKILVSLTI